MFTRHFPNRLYSAKFRPADTETRSLGGVRSLGGWSRTESGPRRRTTSGSPTRYHLVLIDTGTHRPPRVVECGRILPHRVCVYTPSDHTTHTESSIHRRVPSHTNRTQMLPTFLTDVVHTSPTRCTHIQSIHINPTPAYNLLTESPVPLRTPSPPSGPPR